MLGETHHLSVLQLARWARRRRRIRRRWEAGAVGLVALLALAALIRAGGGTGSQPTTSVQDRPSTTVQARPSTAPTGGPGTLTQGIRFTRDHGPFGHGQKVALAEAEAMVSYPLLRPEHPVANDDSIRAVFVEVVADDGSGEVGERVAIDYESGLVVYIEPIDQLYGFEDPGHQYAEMADGLGPNASVEIIGSVPALVVAPQEGGDEAGSVASVDLTLDGVRVMLLTKYAPLDKASLIQIAESLD